MELDLKITMWERFRGFVSRNPEEYWFNHFTDEEKKLRKMDVWELAKVICDGSISSQRDERKIVAEYMLQQRLAKIQSNATYVSALTSAIFGVVGVIVGALLNS